MIPVSRTCRMCSGVICFSTSRPGARSSASDDAWQIAQYVLKRYAPSSCAEAGITTEIDTKIAANNETASFIFLLEDIFQRELKDPGIESRPDLAKRTVVQNSTRVLRAEAVCDVVRFASEFQPLFFTESEASR